MNITVSDIVWGGWILLFLGLELAGYFKVVPWATLSETSWSNEKEYPILRTILLGFLIGLAIHIRFSTGLWKTTLGGTVIALIVNYLWLTQD